MKLTTFRHAARESVRNLARHPLVTLASMSTIALMLVLLGAFAAFTMNAVSIAERAGQQAPIQVWLDYGATAAGVDAVEAAIAGDASVLDSARRSPEDNFRDFRIQLGENADVLDGFDASLLSWSFTVRLEDPSEGAAFADRMRRVPDVRKVDVSLPVMEFLSSIIRWVNLASAVGIACLCVVALFIVSNMVRVAVYSRAEEIAIMKYVGATNLYIRVPYVVEGAVVGLFGALAAWALLHWGYDSLLQGLMPSPGTFLSMLPLRTVSLSVLAVDLVFGLLVGSVGSAMSVRRYVRV